ncbi:glycosyltransferase family 2 protein [Parahaliea aestuarii]|uniref:Glycosyltransferase family 2 protein n=1 Tax=Parahaliea aestuarii TaxID=1852021 RepID=A0A5C8ZPR9_9GAMM|nr:glycosyltransferase family 2 protein [Parahaliea aestuarii]TXS90448.1 glycosyltransferase family 2 protein [Parahaliea aestuarii]
MRCCALIPVYNHPHRLRQLLAMLADYSLPVILVNDGSGPHCTALLRELAATEHATLLEHSENRGKGAALKSGLFHARAQGFSHVLQIDADGQHNLDDIPALLALAEAQPGAMVSGVPRFHNIPALRFYSRYLTHAMVWLNTLSLEIRDTMCGFRIYPLAATCRQIEQHHTGDRMQFDTEIMVYLHWDGTQIVGLPTAVDYPADGISHFRAWRDTALLAISHTRLFFGMLRRLPQLLARNFRG